MSKMTTVKLQIRTKATLDELKDEGETYDAVISKLASQAKEKILKSELAKAYKSLDRDELKILEDWEASSNELEE
ncbi:hypothetical protein HYU40_01850 [Candidatus Woesearchaeota archaeon]|nr:hypothetical protein [Candidatus Woesearchaeota archaeon]